VDTLWLAPFHPSPDRDDGYDITDFYGVDPRYGTGGDFVEFMREARKRGIRVVMDLVINHTSDRHPWFRDARRAPDARHRDWYVWSEKRPRHWNKGMVFPGHQESTWSYDERAGAWYFHRFYAFQPDLNAANPAVRREYERIMGYWLELGVAGFRIDAVPFILELTNARRAKAPQDFDLLYGLHDFVQRRAGDAVLLGEANVPPGGEAKYFGARGEGLHMMFNFWVNQHLYHALAAGDARPLAQALHATRKLPPGCQWAHFLRNHDELDLGRLEEAERALVFERFAPEKRMHLYDRGIRRRLAPMLGDRQQLELAYSLLFSLPGTPVIRYGDEIGMGDDLSLPEREAVRTPMQWTSERCAGFTAADRPVQRIIADGGVWDYRRLNVEAQRRDPSSLLNWTAGMIRLRKECPEIGLGRWTILATGARDVLAIRYDWHGTSLVVAHNLGDHPRAARIRPNVEGGERLVDLRTGESSRADAAGTHRLALDAFGYRWMRVGGVNYAVERRRDDA
jgi:maltose alpha-D-glucosyltransferase/alpha-amylase